MRIVIDMQGAQTESRFRGIGRYTLGFARAIVQNRGEHEVILALSGLFPESIEPIRATFDGLLPQENIKVWYAPGPVREGQPGNDARREVAELIREAFLIGLQPDVIHVTSLFEGYVDDAVTSICRFDTSTPVSVTLYDFIPLLSPDQYFKSNPSYETYYLRKIEYLKKTSRYLAISEASRQEGIQELRQPESLFFSLSPGVEEYFKPEEVTEGYATGLREKFGLRGQFLLYAGGVDERKNLPRLIAAFAALTVDLRSRYQLLLVGRIPDGDLLHLKQAARQAGLGEAELCFTGYVSDRELVQLYNLCTVVVFPSWHEGFGLPALEAMQCGKAVIAGNISSLPEVVGRDDALFDPFDVPAISQKIAQVLEDDAFRNQLCEYGLRQAKKFTWNRTATKAISMWENLVLKKSELEEISKENKYLENYRNLINCLAPILKDFSDDEVINLSKYLACNEYEGLKSLIQTFNYSKINWRIEGPFDSSYSLSLINMEIARALNEHGICVALFSTEGPGDFAPSEAFLAANPDLAHMNDLANSVGHDQASVVSRNLYPPRVEDMRGAMNFLHSYAWEESALPMRWVRAFNTHLDGMTCLSEHVRKVLRDNGVCVPLTISGCGVNHWERVEASRDSILDSIRTKSFRFLHVSSFFPRKGPDALLEAWGCAFTESDDVCLVIKTFPNPHNRIHEQLSALRDRYPNIGQVIVIEDDMPNTDLKALYERCQVLVAPSYAEGFCLPIAEAMLSGIPAITTGWSGQMDFCTPENSWLIDYHFEQADTHFKLLPSVWAEINVNALAKAMREAHQTSVERRREMALNGRELLLSEFSWNKVAERLINFYFKLRFLQVPQQVKVGWVSTWNTKCGIATYSKHLMAGFKQEPYILAAHSNELLTSDDPNCVRCWNACDSDNLVNLTEAAANADLSVLVIQWNFGFFHHDYLLNFVQQQKAAGRVVVIDMHAVEDPPQVLYKKLVSYVPALKSADRLLVHRIADMNHLKRFDLVENVVLFPHGILDTPITPTLEPPVPTIATYGFCLPNKGLEQVVEAIGLLRDSGENVALSMINAEYPIDESAKLSRILRNKIDALGLGDRVTLETRFLSDSESLALLQAANLSIFAYHPTSESASGAVRYGLSIGKPVIVTDIPIFSDLGDAVWKVKNSDPKTLADKIKDVLGHIRSNSQMYQRKKNAAEVWRVQHSYVWLSERLEGMLQGLQLDSLDNED